MDSGFGKDAPGDRPFSGRRRPRAGPRRGFTFLEIQVALAVLMAGLFSMVWLLTVQSRQMSRAEAWCRPDPTYYVVSHTSMWLRKFEAAAELKSEPGQEPWTPPVSGTKQYDVLVQTCTEEDGNSMTLDILLQDAGS